MDVEKRLEKPLPSCPVNFAKPLSLVMDDRLSQPHLHSSAKRVSTKSKAPSPPGLKNLDSSDFSQWYPGNAPFTMDHKEKLVDKDLSLVVVLPDGVEKMTTVHGSKPLMDLLVTLCARYHLNPSSYTLELITAGRHNVKLKPSALIGTLHAEKILLKPKGDDKNKKTGPQKPEATVRMVINYKKTQKAILRVNPQIPLTELLPAICEKCEFAEETTILLRDVQSLAPLDLSRSLNDYAIREVYARDTRGHVDSPACPASPTHAVAVTPGKDKIQKEKENKGLFSKFRKSKKTSEQASTVSAPASPVLVSKPRPLSLALPGSSSPPLMSPTSPVGDAPKKRRAPQPPIVVSQSCHADLGTRQRFYSEPTTTSGDYEVSGLSCGSSAESSLKRTKRKAPQPPTSPSGAAPETVPLQENMQDSVGAKTLEEIMEETSAAASEIQREDAGVSSMSDKGCGVDPSRDLSSDGNRSQSTTSDSAIQTVEKTSAGPDSPQLAASVSCQVESELEAPASQREKVDSGSVTIELESCRRNDDKCLPASVREHISAAEEESHVLSTSHPAGEDARVQTDFPPPPEPPWQQQEGADQAPPPAKEPGFESSDGNEKDIATSAGEPLGGDLRCARAPETCQTPPPPVSPKAAPDAASHPELKPKPSNELTRDYIPKVGMTTYTVVPPKSNEKLRYFEVALTLETAPVAAEDVGGRSNAPKDRILNSTTTPTAATSALNTVNGCLAEATHASSPSSSPKADDALRSSQAGSPGEVKATKIPPATKPKPGSFRLSKQKKTPGYYVTSAAEKSPGASSSPGHMGDQVDRALLPPLLPPPPPPPPPPTVQGDTEATAIQATRVTRQSSLPAKEPSFGLSLEKLKSFAAPRPYSPSTPSRFAQAVSSAVKRSHSLSLRPRPDSSPVTPSCPAANRYSVIERNAGKEFKVDEVVNEKGVEGQLASPSELLRTDGMTETPIAVPYDKI